MASVLLQEGSARPLPSRSASLDAYRPSTVLNIAPVVDPGLTCQEGHVWWGEVGEEVEEQEEDPVRG